VTGVGYWEDDVPAIWIEDVYLAAIGVEDGGNVAVGGQRDTGECIRMIPLDVGRCGGGKYYFDEAV
jgi:hypothetical protein